MKDTLVYIENYEYSVLKKTLKQWLKRYRHWISDDYLFNLYSTNENRYILHVDSRLANDLFFFLINYLKYPEDIKITPFISGYTTANDKKFFSKKELHKRIKVYVPDNDKAYDVVHVLTAVNTIKRIDFSWKIKTLKEVDVFKEPQSQITTSTTFEAIPIPEKSTELESNALNYTAFHKRFYIIFIVYSAILAAFALFFDFETYNKLLIALVIIPFMWVIFEHDYLFNTKVYQKLFIVSLIFIGYGLILYQYVLVDKQKFIGAGLSSMFIFLILQKILSQIYIVLFKKQPDFEGSSFFEIMFYRVPLFIIPLISAIYISFLLEGILNTI